MQTEFQRLINSCAAQDDGFLAPYKNTPWRLGAVLFAMSESAFAVIRKADVAGGKYEFAGRLALPGGMVRASDWLADQGEMDVARLIESSLRKRAHQEASLSAEQRIEIFPTNLGPVATSYHVKCDRKFVLLVAHACQTTRSRLRIGHHSVQDAFWMDVPRDWSEFSPANCVVIAHLLWERLDPIQQAAAIPHVEAAIERCAGWGREIGRPLLPAPWADPAKLAQWRASW